MSPIAERAEVKALNEQWCKAVGLTPRKLGAYSATNKPLIAALDTLETTSAEDIRKLCEQASRDPWCTGKKGFGDDPPQKRGIGCLSATVRSRLLAACETEAVVIVPHNPRHIPPQPNDPNNRYQPKYWEPPEDDQQPVSDSETVPRASSASR